ncbi:sugar phosphate isomerase/epimerase [Neobacillus sp. MM2021_6]|uniref:sugar phosphate isomerase/epimerase family protein n=1 Tax=Bacillaceae TaxID=186817 RepID=UPI00140E9516|nr:MULTISPECIES: sugar phosphate isomerase/epimerase family protein [Bacillaceae]MBO0961735.1 sugar phosphate isomerase/epimerase [Neobacillus sp. MM2021_6]NHC18326.1 sugar phosphate isomerase/epimerase [Bacillus sp. MM2020_4]
MLEQLAINSNTYHGYSLEDAVKGARNAGFTQIELAAVKDHTAHVLPEMSLLERNRVKELLRDYGMKCVGIGAHSNVMSTEGITNLLKSIDLAVEFDCPYIITATGNAHDDADVITDQTELARNLAPIIEKCEKRNKVLVLETHGNNYPTGSSLKNLAMLLNNRVKINYDTANVIFYGNILPYADLEASIDYVEFIHLKDKLGPYNEWNFPAIGDGNLNFSKIFGTLRKANYKGPISVEIEFTPSGPANLDEVNQSVKRSFSYLSKLIG